MKYVKKLVSLALALLLLLSLSLSVWAEEREATMEEMLTVLRDLEWSENMLLKKIYGSQVPPAPARKPVPTLKPAPAPNPAPGNMNSAEMDVDSVFDRLQQELAEANKNQALVKIDGIRQEQEYSAILTAGINNLRDWKANKVDLNDSAYTEEDDI